MITLLFGIGGLLPWNVFITCYDFFYTKCVRPSFPELRSPPCSYSAYPIEFLLSVFNNYACLPMLFLMIKFGPMMPFYSKIAGATA